MLPKVATQIVHSASRAAASIHQTHTIRNVLQQKSTSGPAGSLAPWNTPGSSNWGSGGPGTGSSKHNGAGSRFHYNNAGRAVTQASGSISANDGSFVQADDAEDVHLQQPIHPVRRTRNRSHSLSLSSQERNDRAEQLGVLKTVQLHARSRHLFVSPVSTQPLLTSSGDVVRDVDLPPSRPLSRRNSTSAPSPTTDSFDPSLPAPSLPQSFVRRNSISSSHPDFLEASSPRPTTPPILLSSDPAAPQTLDSPVFPGHENRSRYLPFLTKARDTGNFDTVVNAVNQYLNEVTSPMLFEYNTALGALHITRRAGEPLHVLLRTYNDMLKRSIRPNAATYIILIEALAARDVEIQNFVDVLELRAKHAKLSVRPDVSTKETDLQRIHALRREDNFGPAMSMFSTLISIDGNNQCSLQLYLSLMQGCAVRGDVDNAMKVFVQLRRRKTEPSMQLHCTPPLAYKYLIQAYTNKGDVSGAEEIFKDFQTADVQDMLYRGYTDPAVGAEAYARVWNQMIESYFRANQPENAVGLVEQMLAQSDSLEPTGAPPVTTATFTTVLAGFCHIGDVQTALTWFDRLLAQPRQVNDPYEPVGHPMQPDPVAWSTMIDALADRDMIKDLNRLYTLKAQNTDLGIKPVERFIVYRANMTALNDQDNETCVSTANFLINDVIGSGQEWSFALPDIWQAYLSKGMFEEASSFFCAFIRNTLNSNADNVTGDYSIEGLKQMQLAFSQKLYEESHGRVPFVVALDLAKVATEVRATQHPDHIPLFLHSYGLSRAANILPVDRMVFRDWELLLYAATEIATAVSQGQQINVPEDYAFRGIVSLLEDMSKTGIALDQMNLQLIQRILQLVEQDLGSDEVFKIFRNLGPSFVSVLESSPAASQASDAISEASQDSGYASPDFDPEVQLRIDSNQTKIMTTELWATTPAAGAPAAYATFREGIAKGVVPSPSVIGLLIQNLGRNHLVEELHYAYTAAQSVLRRLKNPQQAWCAIEDSMVIALAHHGDVDGAHIHRLRILEQSGSPSADAYGALIYYVKDTTDDASNAMGLFNESQRLGVKANQYLYNNIISKLAKARKADYALELFQQMKATQLHPTSVTYGAVIGACARVGDVQSAENLFAEMVSSKSFKPRVPPYNTMMQLFTTTKPNRERALHYYGELRKARIPPSGHTYKLLMDAYGAMEPVDIQGMERVFGWLQNDKRVSIQGVHFASLINAYGCVQKNLDKAIAVFDSIPSYPNAQPDAVVFEATINALVANRRTDLMPEWVGKMKAHGVHMTAYIANFLIRGYSMVGDIDQARAVFESLADPPEGVAAPHNHIPHNQSSEQVIDPSAPVYREPSTWEAMVRAELGSGNREGALGLLERLKTRQYPEAVYNRISGIMVDHSTVLTL